MQFQLTRKEIVLMFSTTGTFDLILWGKYFSKLPSDPRKILSLLIRTIKTSLHIIIYHCNSVKARGERRGQGREGDWFWVLIHFISDRKKKVIRFKLPRSILTSPCPSKIFFSCIKKPWIWNECAFLIITKLPSE